MNNNRVEGTMNAQALRVIDGPEERVAMALDLPDGTTFGEWLSIGRRLRLGSQALNWHIGDWWKFGVSHWGEEETRKSALEIWGVEGETARVYGWVATKFEPVNRLTDLTFTHYQRAASLPIEEAKRVIAKAAADGLSVREVQREVQALKVANDPAPLRQTVSSPPPPLVVGSAHRQLTEAYGHFVEAMESLQEFRSLTRRENEFLAVCLEYLNRNNDSRRPCPPTFDVIFVEKGRLECETIFRASRLTVNRWLLERGKKRLIDERAAFVRHLRDQEHTRADDKPLEQTHDPLLPIAVKAADYLRINRFGGWTITRNPAGGWRVGSVEKSSDALIMMAERQGFDRTAAVLQATAEDGVDS